MFRRTFLFTLTLSPAFAPGLYAAMWAQFPHTPQAAALRDNLITVYLIASVIAAITALAWLRAPERH